MLEHSCKKHCIAPTWICAMGLVLELWDNFEFFADVPTMAMPMAMAIDESCHPTMQTIMELQPTK